MVQDLRGVMAPGRNEPVRVESSVLVPDPGPGEAVVKIQACGVCHTDPHCEQDGISDEFPSRRRPPLGGDVLTAAAVRVGPGGGGEGAAARALSAVMPSRT
ncbi:hypothetical protein SGFS_025480 [Streptomyces graminofaciens]|uniref:Alcohol dehydrogenase n=1 Tax=Streptomyces graminofaciens TaxID=68212 RepID=A0ABN5VDX4_9ACTN|nr:hypothetical protein SGFS_025480 [Streptomyces graminofaciens]